MRILALSVALLSACGGDLAPNDAGSDAGPDAGTIADAGPRACSHHVCEEGAYLEPVCNPCVAAICEEDDICCGIVWDESCVLATLEYPDVCSCGAEDDCDDVRDGDLDGDIDCADADCASTPACAAGSGAVGAPCDSHADCAGDPPLCRSEPRFAGGFCSGFCAPGSDECGEGAACVTDEIGRQALGLCWPTCDASDPSSCRAGYECVDFEGTFVCRERHEDCSAEGDEDLDGAIDCADRDCVFDFQCQEECTNGADDNDDGAIDCEDYTCLGRVECDEPICEPPATERLSSCVTLGGYVECNPITNEACGEGEVCDLGIGGYRCFPAEASAQQCAPCVEHGCGPGTTCVGFGPPGPNPGCWLFCCADSDCGPEGFCNKAITTQIIGQGSHIGVCAIDYDD